jgi:hypothetical protein
MFMPAGFRTVTPHLLAEDAAALIEFLTNAFAAREIRRSLRADGAIVNAQVRIGDSMLMISEAVKKHPAMPASLCLYVDDADATVDLAASRNISPIFGILGESLCGVRGFATEAIAVAMAARGKFRTPCKIRRETK